jgi:hypothetical protein
MVDKPEARPDRSHRWKALACGGQVAMTCLVTYPYWSEALRGRFFYTTVASLCMYGLFLLITCLIFLDSFGLLRPMTQLKQHVPRRVQLVAAGAIPVTLSIKWIWILAFDGMEYFHNAMGLGMEILIWIPNIVIDCLIFAGSLVVLWTVARGRPEGRSSPTRRLTGLLDTVVGATVVGAVAAPISGNIAHRFCLLIGPPEGIREFSFFMTGYAWILGPIHGGVAGLIVGVVLVCKAHDWPIRHARLAALTGAVAAQLVIQGSWPFLAGYAEDLIAALMAYLTPVALALAAILGVFVSLRLTERSSFR